VSHLRARFTGQVHGVGFRATTCHFAERLNLTGYVRNCPDGSVELEAEGDKAQLEELLRRLKEAFERYIEKIDSEYQAEMKGYQSFSVTP